MFTDKSQVYKQSLVLISNVCGCSQKDKQNSPGAATCVQVGWWIGLRLCVVVGAGGDEGGGGGAAALSPAPALALSPERSACL